MAKTWRTVILFIISVITFFSLSDQYRSICSYAESVNYAEVAEYLNQNTEEEDIFVLESLRNPFYTLLYYCPELPCAMRYTNVGKYPSDKYQIDPKYIDSPIIKNRIPVLNGLTADYDRVWYASNKQIIEMIKASENFYLESSQDFDADFTVYLLRRKTP